MLSDSGQHKQQFTVCVLDKAAGDAGDNQVFHTLCKVNGVFVVGADVGDLNVNQQRYLLDPECGGTRAQSVTQPDVHVAVPEGAHLELRCNYSSSVPSYLFWYVQYPNQGLQLLLKYSFGISLVTGIKNFEAEFRKSETSFHLKKTSAHLSNSAGYFCTLSDSAGTAGGAEHKLLSRAQGTLATGQAVMGRRLGALLGLLWAQVGWVRGFQVEQSPPALSLQEGTDSTLRCNFSATVDNVQWFRQNPGGSLINLFFVASGKKQNGSSPAMRSDFGSLLAVVLLLILRVSRGENVEQHPSTLRVLEGDSSVINCSYSDSASSYFPWYKQEPGKGPQLIIDVRANKDKNYNQRLTVFLDKAKKHFSLHIVATQPGDSAIYFCAASAQCFPGTCCLHPNPRLQLKPHPFPLYRSSNAAFVIVFLYKWKLTYG
ncbi:T-cell receptor alpha chain V region PY14 [Tupaia chinensis]|nr:T-cell receptor alpha chain V region PY14 [Tupaia chinensis]